MHTVTTFAFVLSLVMFVMAYMINIDLGACEVSKSVSRSGQILQVLFNTTAVILGMALFYGHGLAVSDAMEILVGVLAIVGIVCCSVILADSTFKSCSHATRSWVISLLVLSVILLVLLGMRRAYKHSDTVRSTFKQYF